MVNKNYVSGRRFEYVIKKELQDQGWIAIRSAGSHSPFDIIAIKGDKILLLQLKKYQGGKMPLSEYRKEMRKLFELDIAKTLEPTMAIIQNREGLRKALRMSRDREMRGDTDVI
jgi:Holliday junction resolvase